MPAPKDPKKRATWLQGNRQWHLGRHLSLRTEFKKGQVPWNKGKLWPEMTDKNHPMYGKHHSQAAREKMAKTQFEPGQVPWNAGKKGSVSWNKGKHLSREHVRKILTRRIPSSLEKKFIDIVTKHNLPYKFVGNGSFFIEQYNPDFINVNNEKIAIEVYASFHKKRLFGSITKWQKDRRTIFKRYGWTIIFFDETQVNPNYVLTKLKGEK